MSKIDDLINVLCPDGVNFVRIVDVAEVGTGSRNRNEAVIGGAYNFYVRSREVHKINEFEFDEEAIVIPGEGGIGEVFHFVTGKYSLHQRAYRIHFTSVAIDTRFAFFYFAQHFKEFILKKAVSATVTSIRKPMIEDFRVPVPPIEVQREIVSILDKFTQLEAELEAELEARRKQYEHYQQRLLSFGVQSGSGIINELIALHCPNGVEFKTLGDLLDSIPRGKRLTKSNLAQDGSIPVFHGGLDPIGFHDQSNTPGMTVMVINTGASSGTVGWSEKPFWCSDGCFALPHTNELSSRYLYYCTLLNQQFFVDRVRKAGIPTLAAESVLALSIPVPDIIVQLEIVKILDEFQSLVEDVSFGLPAEITARRKQYEYYRDKLLTFKELEVA